MSTGTPCDVAKNGLETSIDNDEAKQEYYDKYSAVNKVRDEGKDLQDILDNEYPKGRFIDESVINEKINKLYGPMSKAKKYAIKIRALMNANESLAKYILQFAIENIGANQRVGTAVKMDKNGDLVQVDRHLVLSRFPISILRLIYTEALKPTHAVSKDKGVVRKVFDAFMNFNGILSPLITSRVRGLKEGSGAWWQIQEPVSAYSDRVSRRIRIFTGQHKEKGKLLWEGMNNVFETIKTLESYHIGNTDPDLSEKYVSFLSRFMEGRVFQNDKEFILRKGQVDKDGKSLERIVKVGEWMIYADHGPITDDNNFTKYYKNTDDVVHGYQNIALLEEYTPPNRQKGDFYIEMTKEARKVFFEQAREARKIDDEVFKYFEKSMNESLEAVVKEFSFAFPNLNKNEIFQILFKNKTDTSKKLSEKILTKLNPDELEMYNMLYEAFEPILQDEFIIVTGGKVEYRENHWPGLIEEHLFIPLLDNLIFQLENTVNDYTELYKSKKDENGNEYSKEQLAKIRNLKRVYISKLLYAKTLSDKLDDMPIDLQQQLIIPLVSDNKYFKRISNAYDRTQMRTDESVYYDSLKNQSSTVEKNYLVAALIKTLVTSKMGPLKTDGTRNSKLKNSNKMHKIVSRAAINHFKIPFHGTDIYKTGFLSRINPFSSNTIEEWNNALNKIPGLGLLQGKVFRNKTANRLNKTYKIKSGFLTGSYLHGLGTTVQNQTDQWRNIIYNSFDEFKRARTELTNPTIRPDMERIIELAGFTEFTDFFSKAMTSGLGLKKLEAEIHGKILEEVMNFHERSKNKGEKIPKKYIQDFHDKVSYLLSKSSSILSPEDFIKGTERLSKEKLKQRMAKIKQDRVLFFTNSLTQYAITKKAVFRDALGQKSWSKTRKKWNKLKKEGKEKLVDLYTFYSTVGGNVTMESTERAIRSISFVIALNRAQASGLMRQDIPWYKFTETKDINEAIAIGRRFQEKINFGLSSQAMGEYYQGGIGNEQGKFKFWSNQKFGADVRLWQHAIAEFRNMAEIESDAFGGKAFWRMMVRMMITSRGTLKTTNPKTAELKKFVMTQLPLTIAFDAAVFSLVPWMAGMKWIRTLMYMGSGGKALRGFTSDLVSLSFMPFMAIGLLFRESGFEDEEDWDRFLRYYTRKGFFGFMPQWKFETVLSMILAFGAGAKIGYTGLVDSMLPFLGGTYPWNTFFVKPIAEKAAEELAE